MSFDDLLRHTLVVKRLAASGTLDANGQPLTTETTVATVAGRITPKSAREVALASQAGAVIGSHTGYVRPLAGLGTDCWIESGGVRYDVVSIADAGGQGHHLELALEAVT